MLTSTPDERQAIVDYMASQAPDEPVEFLQKLHSENLYGIIHDIWDVHSDKQRWWVITGPTNLYLQTQFPNMDLALTFHVGLCLRIPRTERSEQDDQSLAPFVSCWLSWDRAESAMLAARTVTDYQAIGVRCRECLVSIVHCAQDAMQFPELTPELKRSDFVGWSIAIADTALAGESQKPRRQMLKSSAKAAWDFVNWLTHARASHLNDAEAASAATSQTMRLITTACIRHMRDVPDLCPACGSPQLTRERGTNSDEPDKVYERPACADCEWVGEPFELPSIDDARTDPSEGDCAIMTSPLRGSKTPQRSR